MRGEPKKAKRDESIERKERNSDRVEGDACEGVDTEEPGAEKTMQRARRNDDRGEHNKVAGAKRTHKREVLDQPGGGWQCLGVREIEMQKKTARRFPALKGKRENNEKRTEKIRRSVKKKKEEPRFHEPAKRGQKTATWKKGEPAKYSHLKDNAQSKTERQDTEYKEDERGLIEGRRNRIKR